MAIVNVLDARVMSGMLTGTWNSVKTALVNNDISGALSNFADSAKKIYQYNYQLLADHLPEISQGMTDIVLLNMDDNVAECEMRTTDSGTEKAYYVEFVKDSYGFWRLNFY
jgi:hypothetical protein